MLILRFSAENDTNCGAPGSSHWKEVQVLEYDNYFFSFFLI